MKYTCRYGHMKNGKPEVHPSPRYCDRYVAAHNAPPPGPPALDGGGTSGSGAASPSPGSDPNAGARSAQLGLPVLRKEPGGFSVGYEPAVRLGPGALDQNVNLAWELTPDQSERFWTAIFGVAATIANGLCKILKIKDVPPEVFELDAGQRFIFRTSLRGWTTHHLQVVWRAKTPEDADKVISTIGGISAFGMMVIKLVWHFVTEVPKSPYWEKFQAKRKAWMAARGWGRGREQPEEEKPAPIATGGLAALPPPPRTGATA